MEWLKEVLKDAVAEDKLNEVIERFKKESPKYVIPKERFNEVSDELKIEKAKGADFAKNLDELTKKASSVDEYQKQIADLQAKNKSIEEDAKKQIAQIAKKSQVKELLITNKVHQDSVDLLVDKYSDLAEMGEKGLTNAEKLIAQIKAERKGLFIEETTNSKEKGGGKQDPEQIDKTASLMRAFGLVPPTETSKK